MTVAVSTYEDSQRSTFYERLVREGRREGRRQMASHLLAVALRARLGTAAAEPHLAALCALKGERLVAIACEVLASGTERELLRVLARAQA